MISINLFPEKLFQLSFYYITFALHNQRQQGMNTSSAKYDKTSATSIFDYSKQLLDHSLREFAPNATERSGKGGLGQLVEELFFGYEVNNDGNPDFEEAGVELKCTPLKKSASDELLIKERLVCGMINYCEDAGKPFEESHFFKKCLLMLILFYLHKKGTPKLDLKFLFALLWRLPEKDLVIIRNDYNTIMSKINSGNAHLLSEGDTMYLGACRKGQKGDSLERQPFSETKAQRRAWSLKPSYMRTLLEYIEHSGLNAASNYNASAPHVEEMVTLTQLHQYTFDDIILQRFKPHIGKNCNETFSIFNMPMTKAKQKYAIAANAIASERKYSNVNLTEEFRKSGLMMKTIRMEENGKIIQSMSFENIDYQEIYDCDNWTDSRLYEIFSNRFLFVVYRATGNKMGQFPDEENEYVLSDAFFWTMPQNDLVLAEEYWNDIRSHVLQDDINDGVFWKLRDKKKFHVRPKGDNGADRDISPVTGKCTAHKFCYWFNKDYVLDIVNNHSTNNHGA